MTPLLLGDLFELRYGKSLRKDKRNGGTIPVFGSNGQVDFHDASFINRDLTASTRNFLANVVYATQASASLFSVSFVELDVG